MWPQHLHTTGSVLAKVAMGVYGSSMGKPMRLYTDMLEEGQLIVALVQCGEELHAKSQGGCVLLGPDLIKLDHQPPLEELTPLLPTARAQA